MKKILFIALFIIGCAHQPTSNLQHIWLGMNKADAKVMLGDPTVVRGAITNKFGENIEVWEYRLTLPNQDSAGQIIGKSIYTVLTLGAGAVTFRNKHKDYWLLFNNGSLVQWGEAGDWDTAQRQIHDFRFSPSVH